MMLAIVGSQTWADFIGLSDFILMPFYIGIVFFFAIRFRNKHYPKGHPWRKLFMGGFSLKIFGAVFIGLVYQYYYSGGDTSAFFYHGQVINSVFNESIVKWVNMVVGWPARYDSNYMEYISQMIWYGDKTSYPVCGITAIVSVFGLNTFIPTSILFAALSFTGNWAMFRTFAGRYKRYAKYVGWAVLFIPSTFVWGSGIFKDTICLAALGWLTYASFQLLVLKRFSILNIFIIIVSFYFITKIKVYITLAFAPALLLWVSFTYTQKIKNVVNRMILKITFAAVSVGALAYFGTTFSDSLGKYSFDKIATTIDITRNYIYQTSLSDNGSAYDLGELDPTPVGMLKKFFPAVNVTLFRPYLWESKKPMVLLNAIEAFFFFFFTLRVIIAMGPRGIWRRIKSNPDLQFFFIFTLIFAFAVGVSTYNFGALSRYRIPCLPFFALALFLLYYSRDEELIADE